MILRQIGVRHGRQLLFKPRLQSLRRGAHTEVEATRDDQSNGLQEQIEPQRQIPTTVGGPHSAVAPPDTTSKLYHIFQRHKKATQSLGTQIIPHYEPSRVLSRPPSPSEITLELLLASQAHLGHATALWNPSNARYIYGIREGIHIISLDATASHLRRACSILRAVTERAGIVLFVGTRPGQQRAIVEAAERAGGYHLFTRWIPGTITNRDWILANTALKAVNEHDEEVEKYGDQVRALDPIVPDLVVCLNPTDNKILLRECGMANIPTIGVVDTDCDPTCVTYPIPANDDSLRCMQLFAGILSRAAEEGTQTRLARAKTGQYVTNTKQHSLHAVLDPSSSSAPSDTNIDPTSSTHTRKADSTTTTAAVKIFRAARELGIDLGPASLASSSSSPSSSSAAAGVEGGASASRDLDLSAVKHLNGKSSDEIDDFRLDLHIALKRREMQEVLSERDVRVLKIWSASASASASASSASATASSASASAAQEDAAPEVTSTPTTDATAERRGDVDKGIGGDK